MIRAVREELAAVVAAASDDNVNVYDTLPVEPVTPAICVAWPDMVDFTDQTLAGNARIDITVVAVVGLSDTRLAQIVLDDLMSAALPDAINNHKTDVWRYAFVENISNVRVDGPLLFVDLNVSIVA